MKKALYILATAIAVLAFQACGEKPAPNPEPEPTPEVTVPDFAIGSDVSWLSEMEHDGKMFSDDAGNSDLFEILKGLGQNAIRLRVWVNPEDPQGWSGRDDAVALAKRATAAGMAVMVDFHYSDFFADPGRQTIPKAWTDHSADALAAKVQEHTSDVLNAMKKAGVDPAWVQVGNETRNGMLWPTGQLWDSHGDIPGGWSNFTRLFKAGYEAVKRVFPDAKVIAHIDRGDEDNAWWFSRLRENGAGFDIIGLSYYPEAGKWVGGNSFLPSRIQALGAGFGVPVMITEVGTQAYDPVDGAACLSDLMGRIKALDCCAGIFYWEPEVYGGWKPAIYDTYGWGSYGKGAFTSAGKPSEALKALK